MHTPQLILGLAAACSLLQAESADRDKPIEITANHFDGDEL